VPKSVLCPGAVPRLAVGARPTIVIRVTNWIMAPGAGTSTRCRRNPGPTHVRHEGAWWFHLCRIYERDIRVLLPNLGVTPPKGDYELPNAPACWRQTMNKSERPGKVNPMQSKDI